MDEEARNEKLLSIEVISRFMSVFAVSGSDLPWPQQTVLDVALDVILSLFSGVSVDFLEDASDVFLDADMPNALIRLLE